ncbi:MAG: TIGR01212 family radical SAM protein [Pseudomonadota bacterium]
MALSDVVNTFGQDLLCRYGERVHKLAINAGFTCPNRDGSKGRGGCTFCNNVSFNPAARKAPDVASQIEAGRQVLARRTGARRFLAYFQAYTNTYADIDYLAKLYQQALDEPDVVGLSVGTRPDCVPDRVLDLLEDIQSRGYEVWLELGLQSASERSLQLVNRGHGFAEYRHTLRAARLRGIPVCTHLIVGMPGEGREQALWSLEQVLTLGVDGLKLHPLHVVKGTRLANQWRQGDYQPLSMSEYIQTAADMIERTPPEVLFHRITGTASTKILLNPMWCSKKWAVLNAVESELVRRGSRQGMGGLSLNQQEPVRSVIRA